MLETPFSFLISKKPGEIPIFGTFLAKKWLFFPPILVYFHWKSAFWVRPCLKTSLWRHTLTNFHDFGINGKRRPYPIPWYQTIILWAHQFQVHKGGGNHPLVNHVTKKGLVGRGLSLYILKIIPRLWEIFLKPSTVGVWFINRSAYLSTLFKIHVWCGF